MTQEFRLELESGEFRYLRVHGDDPSLFKSSAWDAAEKIVESTGQWVRLSMLSWEAMGICCPEEKPESGLTSSNS